MEGYVLGGEVDQMLKGPLQVNSLARKKAKKASVKAAQSIIWSKFVLSAGRR